MGTNHLLGDHNNGLGREPAVAVIKKVLERRSEKVNDEDVVQALLSEVVDIRDTGCDRKLAWKKGGPVTRASSKHLRHPTKILYVRYSSRSWGASLLRGSCFGQYQDIPYRPWEEIEVTHEFDSHLLVVQEVGALENDTKRTLTDLLAHTVVDTHYVRGGRCHGEELQGWWSKERDLGSGVTASGRQTGT